VRRVSKYSITHYQNCLNPNTMKKLSQQHVQDILTNVEQVTEETRMRIRETFFVRTDPPEEAGHLLKEKLWASGGQLMALGQILQAHVSDQVLQRNKFSALDLFNEHEQTVMILVARELEKAKAKHRWPKDIVHAAAIVSEESGELVKEALHISEGTGDWSLVNKEAIQTIATCIRLICNVNETVPQPVMEMVEEGKEAVA
jgi:hypothetical protein